MKIGDRVTQLLPDVIPHNEGGVLPSGARVVVKRVRRPTRDTGYDEPMYRLNTAAYMDGGWSMPASCGGKEWTREELQDAGLRMYKG